MNKAINLYLTKLRNRNTNRCAFQKTADIISDLLAQQALSHLKTKEIHFQTPIAATTGIERSDEIVLIPILRSGITMLPSFLKYFPGAAIGVVGLQRNETTAQAEWYYHKLPPLNSSQQIIITDPMIATGGTAIETIKLLQKHGASEDKILFVSMVSAPEGIQAIESQFGKITIICAGNDKKLNDQKFIVPGLGDFGDRYFGTQE